MIRQKRDPFHRWECHCGDPPILLARYSTEGEIEIKVRDRFYFMASRCVQATCPRCGAQHILDLRSNKDDELPLSVFQADHGSGWG